MRKEWLKDRVRLTLINGDKKLKREITYLQLNLTQFDILSTIEENMYKQMRRM